MHQAISQDVSFSVDSVEKSRKRKVVANLPKYQRHLRMTLVTPADRFRTVSVESGVDNEGPQIRVRETHRIGAEKLGRIDARTLSTETGAKRTQAVPRSVALGDWAETLVPPTLVGALRLMLALLKRQ